MQRILGTQQKQHWIMDFEAWVEAGDIFFQKMTKNAKHLCCADAHCRAKLLQRLAPGDEPTGGVYNNLKIHYAVLFFFWCPHDPLHQNTPSISHFLA